MKFSSMRNAIVIASVIVGSVIPSQAFAQQFEFLTTRNDDNSRFNWGGNVVVTSTYNFTNTMILNSIGFATVGTQNVAFSYAYGDGAFTNISTLGTQDANGFSWYELGAGETIQSGTSLKVRMQRASPTGDYAAGVYTVTGQNSSLNVSYGGESDYSGPNLNLTNSNIRVSNPGSNVAPEPGTFALALTGGAALIGICVRRRRNAA